MGQRVFALPDLGEGLEEGVVSSWLVAEGDEVQLNQPIAEIETAKAVVEVPSPFAGRVVRLHTEAGATIAVGGPLITFDVPETSRAEGGPGPRSTATPAVRKLARDLGVDLSGVRGTGPDGRVTRKDVERAVSGAREGSDDVEVLPLSVIRRAIARNLEEVARIPQVTTFRTVDSAALDDLRHELGVSPLPIFVRALAEVCRDHPLMNASWDGDRILVHRAVHAGIATDTERGLVVPVLRHAGAKPITVIAEEIDRLARAARDGTLAPADVTGATIAVTNTGTYGSEYGTPLLNPGHAVTISLGVIGPRPLVVDGEVRARPACTLSLTFDHRVLDGATVGRALGALVKLLDSRERLGSLPR